MGLMSWASDIGTSKTPDEPDEMIPVFWRFVLGWELYLSSSSSGERERFLDKESDCGMVTEAWVDIGSEKDLIPGGSVEI